MALVVKSWFACKSPNSEGIYIRIEGRQAGALAWLLSLLEIDPTTVFEAHQHGIVFTQGSLAGSIKKFIPAHHLCAVEYGYRKPWKMALVIGLATLCLCGLGLVLGPMYYFLSRKMSLGFTELSGNTNEIEFYRSVLEGQAVDEARAGEVIDILQAIYLQSKPRPGSR